MTSTSAPSTSRTLLVYFSRAGENYWNGGRRMLRTGNTERLADLITDRIDCTTWRIEETERYSDRYDPTVQRNVEEQQQNARPGIAGTIPDLTAYDTVLIGSPIWNVRPPMITSTFLDTVDVTGKRVLPFVTYAVSGAGNTTSTYRPLTRSAATLGDPLPVRGEDVADAAADVDRWIRDNRIT